MLNIWSVNDEINVLIIYFNVHISDSAAVTILALIQV